MEEEVDSSKPFQGVVTEIAQRTSDMGGVHKYDLTPDVTHLIVGDYDTPKYRHVAKERPDIMPMAAGWIEDARNMWMADQEFDFAALEAKWKLKTFESGGGIPNSPDLPARERRRLLCCLTGFEDHDMRTIIEEKVRSNGGEYVGDLSRSVTHLITYKPEGKKYMAALRWDIRAVSIEWLNDSAERGMILNESCYDPTLPQEERGVGAWTRKEIRRDTTGKRLRDDAASAGAQNRRKLRKTASLKFNSQNGNLWGDILNQQSPANQSTIVADDSLGDVSYISLNNESANVSRQEDEAAAFASDTTGPPTLPPPPSKGPDQPAAEGVFASCLFFVHGFPSIKADIIREYLTSHGGRISASLDDVASSRHSEPLTQRFLVVPQTSQPDTHPGIPPPSPSSSSNEEVHIVTEFYIERCVHGKRLCDPADHVLGRPFPRFPIAAFAGLTINTTGFADERLNQVEKTVVQLGAAYSEKFNARASVLVAPGADCVPKPKRDFARHHAIPLVDAEWLWQCIATGSRVPWDKYLLQKLEPPSENTAEQQAREREKEKRKLQKTISEPVLPSRKPRPEPATRPSPSRSAWVDRSAFQDDESAAAASRTAKAPAIPEQEEQVDESLYETAPTQLLEDTEADHSHHGTSTALRERTSNALNKSPTTPRKAAAAAATAVGADNRKLKRIPTGGTIADSEAAEDDDDNNNNNNNNNSNSQAPTITSRSRHGTEEEPPREEEAVDKGMEEEATAAATRKRRQQQNLDREKQERTAREKREMSRRLNSLMSSHNNNNTSSGKNGKNGKNGGSGSGSGGGNDGNDAAGAGVGPTLQRRKREVLGRAISNVSAASSNASAESGANNNNNNNNDMNGGGSNKAAMTGTGRTGSVGGSFMSAASGSGLQQQQQHQHHHHQQLFDKEAGVGEPEEQPPPATQLEYDNPEARRQRAVVMDRILRKKGGGSKGAAAAAAGDKKTKGGGGVGDEDVGRGEEEEGSKKTQLSQEKIRTLANLDADVGGVSSGITSSSGGGGGSGVATRRTSRRQKGF
ncbi:putative brct domain-containing protein [Eutypa lata UCREL1]|uniref:Putative brct domain-containing protein n=1 Tax=Eutypa lata (strain UCR-EL1) TaxID=1287681 RepID=M7TJA8_EUTLA|nr:putative brct domain-containing protein [Eutypa lata UCREL1]